MKLTIRLDGRTIGLVLPDAGDVEVDLTDVTDQDEDEPKSAPGSLEDAGPSAKRMYRWIVQTADKDANTSIDPVTMCEQFGLTPIGLGKTIGKLSRLGLISLTKKRGATGGVLRYDVKVRQFDAVDQDTLMDENVDNAKSPWVTTLEDIEADCGEVAVSLFTALCRMADVDGNIVAPPSEVLESIETEITVFPSAKLSDLEHGGWVLVTDDTDELHVSVLGFDKLKDGFSWRGQQPLPSPE